MITERVIPILAIVGYLPALSFLSFVSLRYWNSPQWPATFILAILVLGTLCYRLWRAMYLPIKTLAILSIALGLLWAMTAYRRIAFVIREGGMERADGYGSPLAFVLNVLFEAWALALPAILLAIVAKRHRNPLKAQQLPAGDVSHQKIKDHD